MPKKASTHGASAPSKSKTARSKTAKTKSKDKAAPRKEARKAASEAGSKRTAAAARQEGVRDAVARAPCRPTIGQTLGFAYRDHSPGAESPVFDISMITGSESDGDSPGSTKDPSSSQDAPSQDAPVDDAESSEAKATSTSSPAKNLTSTEGKARAQVAKAASAKRADEGSAAAKKRAAPGSPTSEPSIAKGFKSLFDSSHEDEEEGAVSEPHEISNDLDEQQERYQAAQLQGTPVPPTPVYPRGYYPPDAGSRSPMFLEHLKAPRGLNHGRTSRGAYERALVQDEPLFVNDIEAARCVLLAPHQNPLKELTIFRKKPEDRGGLFTMWGYPWVQPENTITQSQAEDLFWRWVSLKNFTVQDAHLIAKRQLHSAMEGLRQQSKSSAQDERGYGSVNPETVHRKAAKKPPTTYAQAGTLEVLRQDLDALGRDTHKLHGRVDRRAPAAALKELHRGLDALSHEMHGRMPSYEPQGYSYYSAYGYSSYPSSSHSVPSYPSYDSRGYQHSQASTPAAPVVQRTQRRFEEEISNLGLPPSEEKDPADRDTA
ncbi:ABC Superfamily [Phytophthora palmivora]|uniref:ABC Superfamily n=1 Tax=Phytophthora palmivora TaxID=4796 RepID=A0A2P4XEI6_9STRA|nr:ABC Superfamily [Phytophthora palmivora]